MGQYSSRPKRDSADPMYKNKAPNGKNNLCGKQIKKFRQSLPTKTSQKQLADLLQIHGLDLDKNAVSRMENGTRFITDIELKVIAQVLQISYADLLDN